MSIVAPTAPILTTQDKILSLLVFIIILILGWASIEVFVGMLQLLFAPKQSTVKINAPKRIKIGCLTLFIAVLIFFLLGSLIRAMGG
ncbi:hypothetical protein HYT02_01720 [Candidatus Gottesmanbacteria bacterium]|nr:hypothetical protein [Candidatus Gottesmanbacteria bacterium]